MSNKKIKLNTFLIFVFLILFLPSITLADLNLTLKNSPPCLLTDKFGVCQDPTSIEGYINLVYRFMLGVGGFLALGMIVWGAILISLSGGIDKVKEGKDYITSSLFGLALLFGSYLLLKTINPNLVYLTPPTAEPVEITPVTPLAATPSAVKLHTADDYWFKKYCPNGENGDPSQEAKKNEEYRRKQLQNLKIEISSTGNCSNLCNPNCTSVGELPDSVFSFLQQLKTRCEVSYEQECKVVITGGNEVGHQTHAPGEPVFDIRAEDLIIRYLTDFNHKSRDLLLLLSKVSYFDVPSDINKNTSEGGYAFCTNIHKIVKSIRCATTEQEKHIHIRLNS